MCLLEETNKMVRTLYVIIKTMTSLTNVYFFVYIIYI